MTSASGTWERVPAAAHPGDRLAGRLRRAAAAQVAEIAGDRALTIYGAALAAANVLTFVQWKFKLGVPLMIGRGADAVCWPFFESCHAFRLPVSIVNDGLWVWLLMSLACGALFLGRRVTPAWWLLLAVNVIRLFVMFQDYRLRANQHYMLNWIVLAFLFLPGKRALVHHLLAALYFWAGVLKLDPDWLSGAALYGQERLWFPRWLVPASCVYVLVLELGLIWGIYAKRAWIFYGTFGQLVLFHLTSWPIVRFWYPTLMFCLLSLLPLTRALHARSAWPAPPWRGAGRHRPLHLAVLAVLAALQLVPRAFPGDTAVTGEGRLFALHMFDALVECEASITHRLADGSRRVWPLEETRRLPHRSRCDPLIYFSIAKNQCAAIRSGRAGAGAFAAVVDLDLRLHSKRNTEADLFPVVQIERFCAADPHYDVWRHNDWIRIRPPGR